MTRLAVRHHRFTLPSVTGGILAAASWVPEGPRALAIVCHGHAEHLGRYEALITDLVANGYAVYGLDHHGHGRSSGPRKLALRFDAFIDGVETLVDRAKGEQPGLPLVVFGHSMGGLIAVRYALRHNAEIAALVVTGPALIVDEGVSDRVRMAGRLLARLAPRAPIPRGEGNTLSYDPEISRGFAADHRTARGPTRAATALGMLMAGIDARAHAATLTMPLLVLHGADDRLTFPSGSRELYEGAASADKTLELLPEHKHEILNEANRHETRARILTWLDQRLPSA
jgi:alpha-beta hydrolase superfamily lysophospholipase